MEDRLLILIDEMRLAEAVVGDEYSVGYFDGLTMAVSIMEGLTD
jgi:hypothetical protein